MSNLMKLAPRASLINPQTESKHVAMVLKKNTHTIKAMLYSDFSLTEMQALTKYVYQSKNTLDLNTQLLI